MHPKTLIVRHRKENLKKCSLTGLETRPDLQFFTYPNDPLPDATGKILLTLDAPALTPSDANTPLLLIDGTWKYAAIMVKQLQGTPIKRSIPPGFQTSYPRKQTGCSDPSQGLASVEALYIAHHILGYATDGLLDHYYWKDPFLTHFLARTNTKT